MVMEGKRRMVHRDETGDLRKGPWKAEEDQVLINHVKRYGPRDWSSIRSKGLLQRTGKSCRLRWVNKLRPDLKNGVKFSAEEERTVIELQAEFGNKWARIATYLSGRTDNDVKNFWSSRQKRLARILQTSAPSSSKSQINANEPKVPSFLHVPSQKVPKYSSSTQEELQIKLNSCSSAQIGDSDQTIKMLPLPELVYPTALCYENNLFQFDYKKPFVEPQSHLSFPSVPQLQTDFSLPLESQEFITCLGEPNFLDVFGHSSGPSLGTAQLPVVPSFFGPNTTSPQLAPKRENSDVVTSESFMDDFPPIDMFDHLEPLPSPSEWS